MSQANWIGKTLGGRYEIVELLGQGGMSAVYKANDPNLRRVVAVKLIHSHLSSQPQFVYRFEEEAAAVASLRHPNIIQVYDFNHDNDVYYIVFEFIPGESLQAHLARLDAARRSMPFNQVVKTGATISDALEYAHGRDMVHRDVKPANIMLNVHGESILMDFGVVKIVGGDTHTATGAVMGTARYMSPEQIRGEKVDGRTDIYSMGVTLYEMVSGRPPYEADSAFTVMMMHVNDPIPDPRQIRPDVPDDLVRIINRALEKDPAKRFQTSAEMAKALRSARLDVISAAGATAAVTAAGLSQMATVAEVTPSASPPLPMGPPVRAGSAAASSAAASQRSGTTTAPPTTGKKQDRSNMVLYAGIGIAGLIVACIALVVVLAATGVLGGGSGDENPTEVAGIATSDASGTSEISTIIATEEPTRAETAVSETATATATPTTLASPTVVATNTSAPTDTATAIPPSPTAAPTLAPTLAPSPTTAAGPYVRINGITVQGENYVVDYTPIGYTPQLPGTHIHFFWNTVPPQNAGVGPTAESWILYGGPNPFTQYRVSDRPGGATQMCALVANPDHTIQLNTGNCSNLP